MKDKSVLNHSSAQIDDKYINECIKEVCLKGDSITKYKRVIEKKYGPDFYEKCKIFVKEVRRSVSRQKFTDSSVSKLKYIAGEIHITDSTVNTIVKHFRKTFAEQEKAELEREPLEPNHVEIKEDYLDDENDGWEKEMDEEIRFYKKKEKKRKIRERWLFLIPVICSILGFSQFSVGMGFGGLFVGLIIKGIVEGIIEGVEESK